MVTFETKVWEKDWRYILEGDYLAEMIARCNYSFEQKVLYINNVEDVKRVKRVAQEKMDAGIIDQVIFVEEYAERALEFFQIEKSSFQGGYYYSIAELVSIYLCKTPYLLHFSGDSILQKNQFHWIEDLISFMQENPDHVVGNPVWNGKFEEAKREADEQKDEFLLGYGFSDQCYLISVDVFKSNIYNEKNEVSERYPTYGGELFEKRVDAFMRNHQKKRVTHSEVNYWSKNFGFYGFSKMSKGFNKYYIKNRLIKLS